MNKLFTLAFMCVASLCCAQKDRAMLPKPWFSMTCNSERGGPKTVEDTTGTVNAFAGPEEPACCCIHPFKRVESTPSAGRFFIDTDTLRIYESDAFAVDMTGIFEEMNWHDSCRVMFFDEANTLAQIEIIIYGDTVIHFNSGVYSYKIVRTLSHGLDPIEEGETCCFDWDGFGGSVFDNLSDRIPYMGNDCTQNIFGVFPVDSMGMVFNSAATSSYGQIACDANTSELRVEDDSSFSYVNVTASTVWLAANSDTNYSWITMNPYEAIFRAHSGHHGIEYEHDFSPWYTDRSLIDKGFLNDVLNNFGWQSSLFVDPDLYINTTVDGNNKDFLWTVMDDFTVEADDFTTECTATNSVSSVSHEGTFVTEYVNNSSTGLGSQILITAPDVTMGATDGTETTAIEVGASYVHINNNDLSGWTGASYQGPPGNPGANTLVWKDYVDPIIGTSAPSSTPPRIGKMYIDTAADKVYIATGTTSSSDWKILN